MDLRRGDKFFAFFDGCHARMKLSVSGLAVTRSGRPVFSKLGFTLDGGEALALTGPNGSGKSTLLRILAGLLPPTAGSIEWTGGHDEAPFSEEAHYLGHRDALKPALTPLEVLTFWQSLLGQPALSPLDALERVGLGHAVYLPSAYLSAGQRRRLSLARLLVAHRPIWLLDEPTATLDQASETMFGGLVADHLTRGGLAIIATHTPLPIPTRTLSLKASA